jgi:hypothetical protein
MLGFIWIYSSESGFFNGLRGIQIKFFPAPPGARPGCNEAANAPRAGRFGGDLEFTAAKLGITRDYSQMFCFAQDNVSTLWNIGCTMQVAGLHRQAAAKSGVEGDHRESARSRSSPRPEAPQPLLARAY